MIPALALAPSETDHSRPNGEVLTLPRVEASMPTPSSRFVMVPGVARDIEVGIASTASDWEAAFRLVRKNYVESGYEPESAKALRFTPYHALPDTRVFVAKHAG